MRKILLFMFLLSLVTPGHADFLFFKSKKEAPKTTEVEKPKTNILTNLVPKLPPSQTAKSLDVAKELIKELNGELSSAKNSNASLRRNLDAANEKVKTAETELGTVQKNADLLRDWGIDQQNQAFQWMEKYNSTLKKYHRLKNYAAIVAGLFGAMLGMYCMRIVPAIYAAYAFALPVLGAILAFGAVWLFL